ncbi:putative ribonuclease H-like domain-containing protein [Tanacetum coccineum]
MWRLRIEQYFQVQDYALWDVIENGNSFKPAAQKTTNADGTSTLGPVTTEEKYKDAKTFAPRTESLDSIFNRLQKIVSQLAILGENISQEDLNLKFLRSLPSEWNTHVVIWMNKPDLDTMSFDDLYNNLKIVEQEDNRTASSSSSSSSFQPPQNIVLRHLSRYYMKLLLLMELVSTANTQVSPASTQVSTASTQDLKQIHEDDIEEIDLKWQLALLSMRTRRVFQKTGRKITINESDTGRYDESKVECFNCHKMGHFARERIGPKNQDSRNRNQDSSRRTVNMEETSFNAMVAIDGAGFDWSYMVDDEVPTNMALMAFLDSELEKLKQEKESNQLKIEKFNNASKSLDKLIGSQIPDKSRKEEFQQPKFEGYGPKSSKSVSEDISNEVRESPDASLVEELVLDDKLEKKNVFPTVAKMEFVRPKQQEKPVRKPTDYNYHQRERVVSGNNYTKVNYNYSAKKAHPSAHKNMVLRAVLMKTGLRSLNTARPVNTAHPKTTVYSARPMSHFSKSAQSTVKRPYKISTTLTNKNLSQKINTAKGKFYTARAKAVNTARPNSAVVNVVRPNQGHPQKEDQVYVDSGCSRHMTGNMSYLSDFKEFDVGYVTFGGGAKGGKITSKRTLKTSKLDFEDVYFVKELQFNLFSVSQMCDKKNNVLFTDTGCFVLSPDFKLADESQVLLKVPRKNNMYSVDMKNIVPKESLTCLVAKATLDESML